MVFRLTSLRYSYGGPPEPGRRRKAEATRATHEKHTQEASARETTQQETWLKRSIASMSRSPR
jgi:hypothetical protein